ncbi:hypothetical protein FXO37_27340 [Capsicum annuum]|nr:hypothetical protein FXO37_27340 [Capsicum annuum]
MLLRELVSERDDEIWIKVNNTKLWFGLQEFAIISSLKCTRNYNNDFALTQESKLMELYFSEKSKVVLSNITLTVLEKSILHLPDFKSVDAVVNSVDLPGTSKQECSHWSSDNELTLLTSDVKMEKNYVGGNVFDHLVDDVGEKVNFVGDVDVESAAETFKDVLSQNELDWSEISDVKISKFTQPDKSVATIDATGLVCDNVRKVDANASDNIKEIEENMVAASFMLDETPVIPRRLHKSKAVYESLFLSKFDSDCGKVEGQSSKLIENAPPRKRLLFIKHPFVKSITERIDDMKVTLLFNRNCGVFVAAFAEYLLDGIEISNHLDDIDAIRIRYGVLLWNYGKKKQRSLESLFAEFKDYVIFEVMNIDLLTWE